MEFVYKKRSGEWSRHVSLTTVMLIARKRIVAGSGPFHLLQDGERIGGELNRRTTLKRLRNRLGFVGIGPTFRVRNGSGDVVLVVRQVAQAINIIDTNGNDKIDRVWSEVKAEWGNISFLGAYVCKTISGTTRLSQHSYGNAVDIGAGSMETLRQIANWLVSRAGLLSLEHVIVGDRIWTRGKGWAEYHGNYHYHVHVDCSPNLTGPCGVKG